MNGPLGHSFGKPSAVGPPIVGTCKKFSKDVLPVGGAVTRLNASSLLTADGSTISSWVDEISEIKFVPAGTMTFLRNGINHRPCIVGSCSTPPDGPHLPMIRNFTFFIVGRAGSYPRNIVSVAPCHALTTQNRIILNFGEMYLERVERVRMGGRWHWITERSEYSLIEPAWLQEPSVIQFSASKAPPYLVLRRNGVIAKTSVIKNQIPGGYYQVYEQATLMMGDDEALLAEFVYYDRELPEDEIQAVTHFLQWKYGL